jgi:hypothetical protein
LKLTAKKKIGGQTSWSSLITNARRRGLGMNGFLRTRGRMSPAQLELNQPNPKSLETFSMDSSQQRSPISGLLTSQLDQILASELPTKFPEENFGFNRVASA